MGMDQKVISMPIKDIDQLKIVLATWYSFLREQADRMTDTDFANSLKAPVIYDLEKDQVEILFTGSKSLLDEFSDFVFERKKA